MRIAVHGLKDKFDMRTNFLANFTALIAVHLMLNAAHAASAVDMNEQQPVHSMQIAVEQLEHVNKNIGFIDTGALDAGTHGSTLRYAATDAINDQQKDADADLKAKIAAYRKALKEQYTRERAPLNWAAIQHNLGITLANLGEREGDTARLEEAVTAFREALKERTREREPLDWALTLNNLGAAFTSLGEIEGSTALLKEAVAAYREALKEETRERAPLDWARTQNNLGVALASLSQREGDTAYFQEAVAAYREALKEWTRERAPLDWAQVQNNVGLALTSLGEREDGTTKLVEAITAYREALKEWTRERVPLDWATTQNNLGAALASIGKREKSIIRLQEAVTAFRAAIDAGDKSNASDVKVLKQNLANAESLLAKLSGDKK
jgi:tetratricopeptide (TPR) repeat protein